MLNPQFQWTCEHDGNDTVSVSCNVFAPVSRVAVRLRVLHCDEIPDEVQQCVALRTLTVECDELLSLPSAIGQLAGLSELRLINCERLTSLPDALGQLGGLRRVTISCCHRLASLPESLGRSRALAFLYISRCNALTYIPNINQLHALESLTIGSCRMLGAIPDMPPMQQLRKIHIGLCRIAALPPSLFVQPSLHSLRVYSSPFLYVPDAIDLPAIKILHLTSLSQTQIPSAVGQLTTLVELKLGGTAFASLPDLHQLTQLTRFSVDCRALRQLPNLNSLVALEQAHFHGVQMLTDIRLANLTVLSVGKTTAPYAVHAPCLKSTSVDNVTLDAFPDLRHAPLLRQLKISRLCSASLPDLSLLHGLVVLTIWFCRDLQMLPEALGRLPCLEILNVYDCNNLTSLPKSLGHSPTLQRLQIFSCRQLAELPVSLGQYDVAITVERCRAMTYPPWPICERGKDAIRNFLQRVFQREFVPLKVLILILLSTQHLPDELWCLFLSTYDLI